VGRHGQDVVGEQPPLLELIARAADVLRLQLAEEHEEPRVIPGRLLAEHDVIAHCREPDDVEPEQREEPVRCIQRERAVGARTDAARRIVGAQDDGLAALAEHDGLAGAAGIGLLEPDRASRYELWRISTQNIADGVKQGRHDGGVSRRAGRRGADRRR
jgi:hypothetical protein